MQEVKEGLSNLEAPQPNQPGSSKEDSKSTASHTELPAGVEIRKGSDLWRLLTWIQAGQEGLETLKEDPQAEEWLKAELQAMESDSEFQAQRARNQEAFLQLVRQNEIGQK